MNEFACVYLVNEAGKGAKSSFPSQFIGLLGLSGLLGLFEFLGLVGSVYGY
jgi:hypothetical protein